jgi:Flp pilus assembly pilin Flp
MSKAARAFKDESGQSLIEYALLALFIAMAAIILLSVIGVDVAEFFDSVEDVTGDAGNGNEPVVVPGDDNASEAS